MSKKKEYDELDELDNTMLEEELNEDGTRSEEDTDTKESEKSRRSKLMTSLLNNEGENNITSVKDLFKSIDLNGEWFRRNISFILTVTVCLLVFVTNRYQAQQEQIEEARLKKELADMKYKWLTRFSELTTSTRQSQIEDRLKQNGDTTLTHSKDAPFIIRAKR